MYSEPVKQKIRELSLRKAVELLTGGRQKATLADRGYLRRVWKEIRTNRGLVDQAVNAQLDEDTISRWEKFYDSNVLQKKAENLKVAYLCGPEPTNDLDVLVNLGILPENVWAFEANSSIYAEATSQLLASRYPFVKVVKSDIKTFVEFSQIKFDVIYLDFCGPIYNRVGDAKNLETLTAICKTRALASPGILLTNFSLPDEIQDREGYDILAKLAFGYLYPKEFQDEPDSPSNISEGPPCFGINEDAFLIEVRKNLPKYYSQLVTRLTADLFTFIVPMDRFMNTAGIRKLLFTNMETNGKARFVLRKSVEGLFGFTSEGGGADVLIDPGSSSLLWTLFTLLGHSNQPEMKDPNFLRHVEKFIKQLSPFSRNAKDFFEKMAVLYYLKDEKREAELFYSPGLRTIARNHRAFERHVFCDVFLFHQLKDLLIRQLSVPYQLNVVKSDRWHYRAKRTEMFVDMLVFDECRYIYDWMPTLDMLEHNLKNPQIELSYRYILDAISKHNRYYNNEYFSGCAIIGDGTKGFNVKTLKRRKLVKIDSVQNVS